MFNHVNKRGHSLQSDADPAMQKHFLGYYLTHHLIICLFNWPFVQAQIKENIKAPRHWPLWGEFTGDRSHGISACPWLRYEWHVWELNLPVNLIQEVDYGFPRGVPDFLDHDDVVADDDLK